MCNEADEKRDYTMAIFDSTGAYFDSQFHQQEVKKCTMVHGLVQ